MQNAHNVQFELEISSFNDHTAIQNKGAEFHVENQQTLQVDFCQKTPVHLNFCRLSMFFCLGVPEPHGYDQL